MNTSDRDDPVARRARAAFDAAVDATDAATANRLRLARRAALADTRSRPRLFAPLAGAAALGLVAWLAWPRTQLPAVAPAPVEDTPAREPARVLPPDAPLGDGETLALPDGDVPVDEETALAALDDEEAEIYAWLADAPVAPDIEEDAL